MKVERFSIKSCCGRTVIIFKTDCSLHQDHIDTLKSMGWSVGEHYIKSGLLYVYNLDFIMTGPLGADRLTVKCRHKPAECAQKVNDLEVLLQQVG
jgi:hypothetical protein